MNIKDYPVPPHNPDKLRCDQIPDGWRLLLPEEVDGRFRGIAKYLRDGARWIGDGMKDVVSAMLTGATYIVPIETPFPMHYLTKPTMLPSSGSMTSFDTGAVRDAMEGKGLPSCIPPCAIRRLAQHFERGRKKYPDTDGKPNWMKGIPLSRLQDAIMRHTLAWAEGDQSEDHAAAVLWNMACALWTEERIAKGDLPTSLMDLPFRKTPENLGETPDSKCKGV